MKPAERAPGAPPVAAHHEYGDRGHVRCAWKLFDGAQRNTNEIDPPLQACCGEGDVSGDSPSAVARRPQRHAGPCPWHASGNHPFSRLGGWLARSGAYLLTAASGYAALARRDPAAAPGQRCAATLLCCVSFAVWRVYPAGPTTTTDRLGGEHSLSVPTPLLIVPPCLHSASPTSAPRLCAPTAVTPLARFFGDDSPWRALLPPGRRRRSAPSKTSSALYSPPRR